MKRGSSSICQAAILAAVLISLGGAVANAAEWSAVGSRYQAMGGSGVASVNDAFASYWNPAALGGAESWDADLNFDLVASVEGDAIQTVEDVEDEIEDTLGTILDDLEAGNPITPGQEQELEGLIDELRKLDENGIGVVGSAGTGLNLRWQRYAVFSRGQGEFAIDPAFDPDRLETDNNGPNSLVNNRSGARVRGLGVVESGVGYGHRFDVPFGEDVAKLLRLDAIGLDNLGRISVGANLKYLHGLTYTKYVGYRTFEDAKLDFGDSDLREESGNFGLDLGFLYEPVDFLAIGMTARNVNSPKFDTGDDDDDPNPRKNFQLDAQVRGGIAVFPFKDRSLVIASDLDLTENKSDLLAGFKSRLWSFGAEYTLPIPVVKLALRGGGYTNTASGSDSSFVFTGGLGLKVWLLSLDLAGGASSKGIDIGGGDKLPSRMNVSAVLALKGNF